MKATPPRILVATGAAIALCCSAPVARAFAPVVGSRFRIVAAADRRNAPPATRLFAASSSSSSSDDDDKDANPMGGGDTTERTISAAPLPDDYTENAIDLAAAEKKASAAAAEASNSASTNTVNERLLAELEAAQEGTKYGKRSKLGQKIGAAFRSERTDEERQKSIEEARNLNGVNPLVALGGAVFALGMAALLWSGTGFLGDWFLTHPVGDDAPYAFVRATAVFRNAVMGLSSLASGFAGVTGLGLFLLGVRVAYGVATGELDPTPIKKGRGGKGGGREDVVLPNVLDLMMNKRPDRRGRRGGKSDDNPFGL
uniref:Uncharacterized protein n=1 Tax=Odontella aurita TaxID=265563 RepID=A0A7S4N355_9STRA